MMKKAGCTTITRDCAVGFNKDLLELMSQDLGFSYSLKEVDDNRYGIQNKGRWNGMIGEVVNKVRPNILTWYSMIDSFHGSIP